MFVFADTHHAVETGVAFATKQTYDEAMIRTSKIVSNPGVLSGKPCVAGTRISVQHILRELATGGTIDELIEDYPALTRASIQAALEFAAEAIEHERVFETVA